MEGRKAAGWGRIWEEKEGINWVCVLKVEKDMKTWIGGCVGLIMFGLITLEG